MKAHHSLRCLPCPECCGPADRQFHVARPDQMQCWFEGFHTMRSDVAPDDKVRTRWHGSEVGAHLPKEKAP